MDFTLFNNVDKRVVDDLKVQIQRGSKLQIAAASFSIYAFEALREELQNIDSLQFLFTSPTFTTDKTAKEKREFYIPKLNRERNLYGTDFEIRLRNQLSQKAIARECAEWIRSKVKFKTKLSRHCNITSHFKGGRSINLMIWTSRNMSTHRRIRINYACAILYHKSFFSVAIVTRPGLRHIVKHSGIISSSAACTVFEVNLRMLTVYTV